MIDIHTHILPNVDDGSSDFDTSCKLLELELENGVNKVICTPHQNYLNLNKELLIEKFNEFKNKINLDIELYLGSEIYYYKGFLNDLENGKLLTINNSKYILIEFSTSQNTDIIDIVYSIKLKGYIPIIAHIERYSYLNNEDYLKIKKEGALIQINASSFNYSNTKKIIKYLLKNNLVDFVASDCHDLNRRSVDFFKIKKYIYKKYKEQYHHIFENDYLLK